LEAYRQILSTKGSIDMLFVKVIFLGAPRLGKTTTRRRLTGEIDDIDSAGEPEQPSTGSVEMGHNVVIRNLSSTTAVVTPSEWSATKDLTEEANMLLQFFYQASPAPKPNRGEVTVASTFSAPPPLPPRVTPTSIPLKKRVITFFRKAFHIKKPKHHGDLQRGVGEGTSEKVNEASSATSVDTEIAMSDDEIFSFFTEALSTNLEEIKFLFENTALLNMSDTGGQPEFMDMLPALVIGPALYLLFCKLNQPLQSHYTISYLNPSSCESTIPVKSSYTVEEVMFQALSAITCLSTPNQHVSGPPSVDESTTDSTASSVLGSQPSASTKSKAFIVGTHKDLVSEEEIEAFDADIQKRLRATDFFNKDVIQFASENRLVLTVDNKSGGAEEISGVRKFLEEQMQQIFNKLSIPAAWLVFSLCLRKSPKRTTSLQDCLALAQQLDMSAGEAKLALWFLHHHAGVLMYFPDLPELHDTVINDIQVVYDSVTNLIVNTFKFGRVSKAASERFQETGQFCFGDIRRATASASGDFIPLQKLVRLLEHLHILAPVDSAEIINTIYLMPCVLQNAAEEELSVCTSSLQPLLPLMIRYVCGFVPIGVFPAMIANLVGQSPLKLIEERIKKNRVQFRYGINRDIITFISRPRYYEIHISRVHAARLPIHEVCEAVRDIVQSTLQVVTSRLNYPFSLSYQLSFMCPVDPEGDHLCVVDKEETSLCFMDCLHNLKNPEAVEMKDLHLVWFGKVSACLGMCLCTLP
jgi:GTPase SAR1 family protein